MNPREFYDLAGRLIKINSRAEIRSAISRAYYAAFHVGREVLGGMDPKWKKLDHNELPTYLQYSSDPEFEKLASQMNDFRQARNRADYNLDDPKAEDKNRATLLFLQADHIMKTLEERSKGPNSKRIVDALIDYERRINVR